jgi:predicted hydrolase (HD superfamily)
LLAAGETITGLIVATALVYPDKKLASVKPKSVRKRIKEKAFAAGANRDIIRECEVAGVPLAEFCDLSLLAMQGIDSELGL